MPVQRDDGRGERATWPMRRAGLAAMIAMFSRRTCAPRLPAGRLYLFPNAFEKFSKNCGRSYFGALHGAKLPASLLLKFRYGHFHF
jgi:hypothetical protein